VFCIDRKAGKHGTRINIARADTPEFYEFLKRTIGARIASGQ
jgi:hypothetical protein